VRGLGKLESLRAAQLALLRGTLPPPPPAGPDRGVGALVRNAPTAAGRLAPAYWAGFVLSGDRR
jgi:CHAT domain-containing protein